jgi:hypothetical protein
MASGSFFVTTMPNKCKTPAIITTLKSDVITKYINEKMIFMPKYMNDTPKIIADLVRPKNNESVPTLPIKLLYNLK